MDSPALATTIDGRIEAASDGRVIGWAWRRDDTTPVEVEVLVDRVPVVQVTADVERASLADEGIGDGRHGFAVRLPEELAVTGERLIAVVVLPERVALTPASGFPGTTSDATWLSAQFVLDPDPSGPEPQRTESSEAPEAVEPSDERRARREQERRERRERECAVAYAAVPVVGVVESIAVGAVTGWLPADGDHGRVVRATSAGELVGEATADADRPDLGVDRIGFRLELTPELRKRGPRPLIVTVDDVPLAVGPQCLRPLNAPIGKWSGADLRLAQLDESGLAATGPGAVLGADGWRFAWPAPAAPQEAALERAARRIDSWAAAHQALGIPYVLAILPARERLERDRLPTPLLTEDASLIDRLRRLLDDGDGPEVVDLLPALHDGRRRREVSLRTGSGLSAWGAFVAARAALREVGKRVPGVPVPPLASLTLSPAQGYRGDLVGRRTVVLAGDLEIEVPTASIPLLALGESTELPDAGTFTANQGPTPDHLSGGDHGPAKLYESARAGADRRVILLGRELPPTFVSVVAEQVSRCVVLERQSPAMEAIELEMPNAVLHVIHERELLDLG
jgi:hypothetical protein